MGTLKSSLLVVGEAVVVGEADQAVLDGLIRILSWVLNQVGYHGKFTPQGS